MNDAQLSRRKLLLAAGVVVTAASLTPGLAGCDPTPTDATPTPAPDEPLTPVLLGQQRLLARYEQTLSDFPALTPTLSGLQDQSEAHTAALLVAVPAAAAQLAAQSSSAAATSSTQSSEGPEPTPAADAATALSDLARAVDAAAGRLRAAAQRESGELAALLGSCAASTACHAWLLGL